ncbi:MAG: hypothetical protein NTX50_09935 [Candidatus Sumerlaeota bacterium]|nr:hypothetical protein [Candidatus Sumerlaeota bacterium]
MSRLLLLGCSPLPCERERVARGPGLRAWQFLKPLRRAGHDVRFMALRNESDYRLEVPPIVRHHLEDGFSYEALKVDFFCDPKLLIAQQDDWRPDAVLGVGSVMPAHIAVLAADLAGCPSWADFFGDPLAELQARDAVEHNPAIADRDRLHVGRMMTRILARADRVSVLMRRHEDAVLGQLGFVGRLNRHTVGYKMTCCIPCGVDLDSQTIDDLRLTNDDSRTGIDDLRLTIHDSRTGIDDLRLTNDDSQSEIVNLQSGNRKPETENRKLETENRKPKTENRKPFTLCLGGSFNTWMDIETLADGLQRAMRRCERIRLCVTGGGMAGYSERLYNDFVARMTASGLIERCDLHGWVPNEAVLAIHAGCQAGLNVDRWTLEGVFGSRNRVIQWLHAGLPVITSLMTEVTEDLAAAGGVIPFQMGDAESLASAILDAAEHPERLSESLQRGREYVRRHYNLDETVRDVLAWAAAPAFAPDRARLGRNTPLNSLHASFLD